MIENEKFVKKTSAVQGNAIIGKGVSKMRAWISAQVPGVQLSSS